MAPRHTWITCRDHSPSWRTFTTGRLQDFEHSMNSETEVIAG